MFKVTRFCVQEYLSTAGGIRAGEVREFRELDEALRCGRQIGGRRLGATIYKVEGEPPSDIWREPELVEAVGYVPPADLDLFRPYAAKGLVGGTVVAFTARAARTAA